MTNIDVTIEHPGAHEPSGDTFADDLNSGITKSLHAAGLKRGENFLSTIVGYIQTSGVATVYSVEVENTEPSAAAKKADEKADADPKGEKK